MERTDGSISFLILFIENVLQVEEVVSPFLESLILFLFIENVQKVEEVVSPVLVKRHVFVLYKFNKNKENHFLLG